MFQHSQETIGKHLHKVLIACLKFSITYFKSQDLLFLDNLAKIEDDKQY